MAEVSGADVATSDDLTGNAGRGGDWDLETTHGTVATAPFAMPRALSGFTGILAGEPADEDYSDNAGDGAFVKLPRTVDGIHYFSDDPEGNAQSALDTLNVISGGNTAYPSHGADDKVMHMGVPGTVTETSRGRPERELRPTSPE